VSDALAFKKTLGFKLTVGDSVSTPPFVSMVIVGDCVCALDFKDAVGDCVISLLGLMLTVGVSVSDALAFVKTLGFSTPSRFKLTDGE
jgi:hypothetical protein